MKKTAILVLSFLFLLSSCVTGTHLAISKFESFIAKVEQRDIEGTRSFFAPNIVNTIDGFDEDIELLFDYFQGSYEEILDSTLGQYESRHDRMTIEFYEFRFWEVKTTTNYYYFYIYWCMNDENDADNEGIWQLIVEEYELGELGVTYESSIKENDEYNGITLI